MEGNLGLSAKVSLAFVIFLTLRMMSANVLGGIAVGSFLFLIWAALLRLSTFVKDGKGYEFTVSP